MSPFAVEALAEGVRALTWDPVRAAVFCDIDSTLSPVAARADDAQAPGAVSRLLGALGRRYVQAGVRSEEGPRDVVIRADLLADGVDGFARVLEGLFRAAR